MNLTYDFPTAPESAVFGSPDTFTVKRIFCVGRNYAAHAREMGMDPDREAPFFFTKFPGTLVPAGGPIPYPPATSDYQFEAELVIAIGSGGFDVRVEEAASLIFGYAVGLDMTRRDLQMEARNKGRPWDTGKNFAFSSPMSTIHQASETGYLNSGKIELKVNGETKQISDLGAMIWNCVEIIAQLSALERLYAGDVIFTGTPAGVGAVSVGDQIEVTIEGLTPLSVKIAPPADS